MQVSVTFTAARVLWTECRIILTDENSAVLSASAKIRIVIILLCYLIRGCTIYSINMTMQKIKIKNSFICCIPVSTVIN